jgi:16S rRNA (guanine966-N2)-methyltransferase
LRIISGTARGRRIAAPEGGDTRPTHDRVREAVFSMLLPYMDEFTQVLDLFAGSGAMGLEALSRGAAQAVFVDKARPALLALRENIRALQMQERAVVLPLSYEQAVKQLVQQESRFDLVFLDPPYDKNLMLPALSLLQGQGLLRPGAVLVCEHRRGSALPPAAGYRQMKHKQYGQAEVSLLIYEEAAP